MCNYQIVGLDIGRGFVKGYSKYKQQEKECCFKSIVGMGREMDFSEFQNPIYIESEGEDYFVGELAEIEGDNPIQNSRDSKITTTVEKLINAAINEIVIEKNIKIMLGVPNKLFNKKTLDEIISFYKGKEIKISDKINGGTKEVKIQDILIFKEADSALIWEMEKNPIDNEKAFGMVTIGFRTTEFAFFDKKLRYVDKNSKTMELGNKTSLEYVARMLKEKGIIRELFEIDSSDNYDDLKNKAYVSLSEKIEQEIENLWVNLDEMNIYIAGGTALNMKFNENFKVVENPQMSTAKGLWLVGKQKFN
ncbi:ParM/StbA family protein [Clostridium perfringens]|uniref:ParM/StbA family protein n=1 Tax=Clostridium perfringens TaxID=1502 RepID=UPI001ABA1355|nr:ParM/StbA family protein [Clostridium perfringens]MBO3304341.1 ParM/StbA family protein [Clostridium perfringens]MBO3307661.1 ParM/StbA family protein [Clostridium perfringens]MBO3311021.1 ParM/StbA family protein [Clostridium perfringens]MBO3317295.1 ParM/StbA family protein [Clostridium perfringens]